jgi:hypothetical protein
MRGADGKNYAFRSLDKEAARAHDPELRNSIAGRVLQDQIGSMFPASPLVVAPLLDAAGVLHAHPRLALMPDDPRLGQFRQQFAGMLGWIEERPNEGEGEVEAFGGADSVTGSDEFLDRLEESSRNRVDDAAYLRARLIDLFVGDWDRHPDQWRWAGYNEGGRTTWRPIPRDRDWALGKLDGVLVKLIPLGYPHYVGFGSNYPSAFRLTWSARALDRRLLSGTSRETWNTVVADLQRRLTDQVIDDAARSMPPQYYARIGAEMAADLRSRRDQLDEFAEAFYRVLAGYVDIHTTDERDIVEVVRMDSSRLRVEIGSGERGATSSAEPWFRRVFDGAETKEVRLYLHGGDDHAAVIGSTSDGPTVRIIGGGDNDALIDRTPSGSGVRFYDDRGDNRIERAGNTHFDAATWVQPMDSSSDTHKAPARDWGTYWIPTPGIGYDTDMGAVIGAGFVRYRYGFRHYPYQTRLSASVGYGTSAGRFRGNLRYDFPLVSRTWRGIFNARYEGADMDRFFGFGNETPNVRNRAFYEAQRSEGTVELHLAARSERLEISAGPGFATVHAFESEGTLVDSVAPYGFGDFDRFGATARLFWDGRDNSHLPTRGAYVLLESRFYPKMLDVDSTYGGFSGEAAGYLTAPIPLRPTLALRIGGEKVFGDYPYFDAAYIGGKQSVRGFQVNRFAGDASLFGNAELRLTFGSHQILMPGHLGVLGLADAGRVFFDDEDSDEWHAAVGGGFWLSFRRPAITLNVTAARSDERTGLYIGSGFAF